MLKSTYGTGCFALLNTGRDMVRSRNRLLTTIAYRLNGVTTYASKARSSSPARPSSGFATAHG